MANICYSSNTPSSQKSKFYILMLANETTADRNPDSTSSDITSKDQKKKFESYRSIIPSPQDQPNFIQLKPQSKNYRKPITTYNTVHGVTEDFCGGL